MKILVVEDEVKTAAFLKQGLTENGFDVDVAPQGQLGLEMALDTFYDLLILDVMLPRLDGWRVIEALRAQEQATPVLFLTARDAVEDRVKGLQLGADDYLVKPFAFSELLARVQVLLRRRSVELQDVLHIEDLHIDLVRQKVTRQGQMIELPAKEFQLLATLAKNSGTPLTRQMLSSQVWGVHFDSETNVVDVAIRRLRQKMDDPFEQKLIHTIRGVGYVLKARK